MKKANNYIFTQDIYKYFCGKIIEYVDRAFVDLDKNIVRCRIYSLFPFNQIDGKSLFNGYGQQIYNNLTLSKKEKKKIEKIMKTTL